MRPVFRNLLLLIVILGLLAGGLAALNSQKTVTAQTFDRREMLTNITNNVILPYHAAFAEQTHLLQEAAHAFHDDPTLETLAALQQAWRDASFAWEHCAMFEFGRMTIYHSPINRKPTEPTHIEELIMGEEVLNEAYIDSIGSSSKGLPALEYLLFDPAQDNEAVLEKLTSDVRHMEYMVAAAENLQRKADDLYNVWLPEGENYAETFIDADGEGAELRESLSMLTNQIVFTLEQIIQMKLGRPLGLSEGTGARPDVVEAYYSGYSLPQIIANLEAIQQTFIGGEGLGLADYLDFLGAEYDGVLLSDMINDEMDASLAALRAIDEPFSEALVNQYDTVLAAFQTVRELFLLMQTGMTSQLGVTLTFTDNDGD